MIEAIKKQLPEFAKDIKLNIAMVLSEAGSPGLIQQQIDYIALTSAYACRNQVLIKLLMDSNSLHLTEKVIYAAQQAAMIMAMNNVYYRFTHLVNDAFYTEQPAKLRMNVMSNPGVGHIDFELACMAVSAINGCGLCMESHAAQLARANVDKIAIQSAVKIAAVMHATALGIGLSAADSV